MQACVSDKVPDQGLTGGSHSFLSPQVTMPIMLADMAGSTDPARISESAKLQNRHETGIDAATFALSNDACRSLSLCVD